MNKIENPDIFITRVFVFVCVYTYIRVNVFRVVPNAQNYTSLRRSTSTRGIVCSEVRRELNLRIHNAHLVPTFVPVE